MDKLFREEVIASRAASIFGDVSVGTGLASTLLSLASLVLAALLIALLIFGTYSRKEHAAGYLVPSAGLIAIYSPRSGVVTQVNVKEGESVKAGAPILTVTALRHATSGIELGRSRIERLNRERRLIMAQIGRQEQLSKLQMQKGRENIEALKRQLANSDGQRKDALERLAILRRIVGRLKELRGQDNVAPSELDARQASLLQAQRDVHVLEGNIDRIEGKISELMSTQRQIPLRLEIQRGDLSSRALEIQRSLDEAEVARSTVIHAPIAGKVTTIIARPGMNVNPHRRLLSIIPLHSKLQAELLIPTRAIGFIRKGQAVELRYDAFPYQKYGLYRGRITSISSTVLNPEDQTGPIRLSAPAYRAIAKLNSELITVYGRRVALQPGLTLKADIVRDRRTIIEWIFDPLLAAAGRI